MKTARLSAPLAILYALLAGSSSDAGMITFASQYTPGVSGNPGSAGLVPPIRDTSKFEFRRDMISKTNTESGSGINSHGMTSYGGKGAYKRASDVNLNEAVRLVNWLDSKPNQGFGAAYDFHDEKAFELWGIEESLVGGRGRSQFRRRDSHNGHSSVDKRYSSAQDSSGNASKRSQSRLPIGDRSPTGFDGGTAPRGSALDRAFFSQAFGNGPTAIEKAGGLRSFDAMVTGRNSPEGEATVFEGNRGRLPVARVFSPAAAVPEPSSLVIWGMMCLGGWHYRKRTSRHSG